MNAYTPKRSLLMTPPPRKGAYRLRTPCSKGTPRRRPQTPATIGGDRFIPNRSRINLEVTRHSIRSSRKLRPPSEDEDLANPGASLQHEYQRLMKSAILDIPMDDMGRDGDPARLLPVSENRQKQPALTLVEPNDINPLGVLQEIQTGKDTRRAEKLTEWAEVTTPWIPTRPEYWVDVHGHEPILSWSKNDIIAVGLGYAVYLWNYTTNTQFELVSFGPGTNVTALAFSEENHNYLAIGTTNTLIDIWDVAACRRVRCLGGHKHGLSCLDWNRHILSTGSRGGEIIHFDSRNGPKISEVDAHFGGVWSIKWDTIGRHFASSGFQENEICIWDYKKSYCLPRLELEEHEKPVPALVWSPLHPHVLATGSYDNDVVLWNGNSGDFIIRNTAQGPVSGLAWCTHRDELLSSQCWGPHVLKLWTTKDNKTLYPIGDIAPGAGFEMASSMVQSPCGTKVVASDTNKNFLTIWNIFDKPTRKPKPIMLDFGNPKFGLTIR